MKHLLNTESYTRGIALSSVFNVISKLVLFVVSLMLIKYFGASIETDIFFYLYNTLWLGITVFSSLNVAVIIPEAMHRKEREGEGQAMRFFTFFFYVFAAVSLVVMGLLCIDPVVLLSWVSKYDISVLGEFRTMILYIAPLFPLILITQYLIDLLNAYRYFTLPVLTGLFNNLLTLVIVCALHRYLKIYVMILAVYLGYFINLIHIIYVMRRDFSWNFRPGRVDLNHHFKQNFWVGLFGNFWNLLGKYAPNYFMSASGAGLYTAFSYGQKINNIPTEAITNQFSSVAAIRFNELMAKEDRTKLRHVFLQSCNMLTFILVPIAAMFFFYAEELVSFLYLRGAFSLEDVKNTAYFVKYLGFLLPLFGISTMVTRVYNAGQIVKFSTIYGVISNILVILLLWLAYSYWGIWGVPFAFLGQNLVNVLAAQIFMRYFFRGIGYGLVLWNFLLFTLGCMALAGGIYALFSCFSWPGIVKAFAGGFTFLLVYIGANEVFKINTDVSKYLRIWKKVQK